MGRICMKLEALLESVCKKGVAVLEVKTLRLSEILYTHSQGVQAACNPALKRVERPLACVVVWRKEEYFQENWTRIPACLSREAYFFLS